MIKFKVNKYSLYTLLCFVFLMLITLATIVPNNHKYLTTKDSAYENSKSLMANDAILYINLYEELTYNVDSILLSIISNKNLLPPLIPFYMSGGNLYVLYAFYLLSLLFAVKASVKYVHVNRFIYILLMVFSPIVISQTYGPNKEITGYISMTFLLGNILSGQNRLLLLSLVFSLFTRLELFAVIIIFKFIQNSRRRTLWLLIFVISLSLVIPFVPDRGEYFLVNSGVMHNLNILDKNFLYFLSFPFKVIMGLYVESVFGVTYRLGGVFIVVSSWFFIFLTIKLVLKNRFSIYNDLYLILLVFLLVFCTGAFVQHRYLLPVYPFFVYLALCTVKRKGGKMNHLVVS